MNHDLITIKFTSHTSWVAVTPKLKDFNRPLGRVPAFIKTPSSRGFEEDEDVKVENPSKLGLSSNANV